jgi:signal recognition particle subunit SRP54
MPGRPGGRKAKAVPQRRKSKSGNPAKRAAEERAASDRAVQPRPAAAGSAFGLKGGAGDPTGGAAGPAIDPTSLPKGFEKFLHG